MLGVVLRLVFLLALLAAVGFGGWWLFVTPPPPSAAMAPRAATAERAPRPAAVAPPAAGTAGLQTPFGDAMFRWRCTAGLREAIGEHSDWPLRRIAAFCLCVADRLREEGLRDLVLSGGDTATAVTAAEASVCRR